MIDRIWEENEDILIETGWKKIKLCFLIMKQVKEQSINI